MGVHVVSLQETVDLEVPPRTWTLVQFSYGSMESYDVWNMHPTVQPDGTSVTDWKADSRSALVWPSKEGWGELHADLIWKAGDYQEIRDQFVRDPLGVPDYTSVEHRPLSPGAQYFAKHHGIFVHTDTPVALQVYHDATEPVILTYAQLKLVIHDVGEPTSSGCA